MVEVVSLDIIMTPSDEIILKRAAGAALSQLCMEQCGVCLALTTDRQITWYNKRYREKDGPTDVLSFSQMEGSEIKGDPKYLGDVIISVETAARQAEEYGHSLHRELAFLGIHGILHLMGFDHINAQDEKIMIAKQQSILAQIDL